MTLGFLPLVLIQPPAAIAQEAPELARFSVLQGDVFALPGGSKDWMVTTANAPVRGGDSVATGPLSRAELQFDYAHILRLDQNAEVRVANLSRAYIQIQLATGRANFTIRRGAQADVEIDTPNMAVRFLEAGDYRVQVNSPNDTQLTVWQGRANVAAGPGNRNVAAGQAMEVKGADDPDYQIVPASGKERWDLWNDERDYAIADAQSWQYTNHYYVGSEDLDRYGDWSQVPGYGWCWTPFESAGWVPYRNGRWISDPYYQWLWVGYEPWGWAPYHYGRWINYGGNWCWWPGTVAHGARPDWAPGYVAFLGLGGHPGNSGGFLEFDSIGWCPLGPHDHFEPWWGSNRTLNTTDIASVSTLPDPDSPAGPDAGSNLQEILTNPQLRAAVTTVSSQNFANGRIGDDLYPVNVSLLEQGSLIQGPLPVTPTKLSVQPVDRPVNHAALPSVASNQHFVTRSDGPALPFAYPLGQMNPPLHASAGLTGQVGTMGARARPDVSGDRQSSVESSTPAAKPPQEALDWRRFGGSYGNPQSAPAPPKARPGPLTPTPQGSDGGWRHFGTQPPAASRNEGVAGHQGRDSGGWKHFGSQPGENSPAARGEEYRL